MPVGLAAPGRLAPVKGIRLSAGSAGIYPVSRPDLVLIAMEAGTNAAALFTRNAFCAAPVSIARSHLSTERPRYCVINAGNANAGTGTPGNDAALATCAKVAELGKCRVQEVLPFSTGVIGEDLPVGSICAALPGLFDGLRDDVWLDCARAIMTTDTMPKGISRSIEVKGTLVTITGIAKGSGMIHPNMATMLAFIATDADVAPNLLQGLLADAAHGSFNAITVDGDTSTNDALLLMATGKCGLHMIADPESSEARILRTALGEVCLELAWAVIRDGEGATKFITIKVEQGGTREECVAVANTVATSSLVKTAFYASDPNWGRILAAIGRSGLQDMEIGRISVDVNGVCIVENGARSRTYTESAGQAAMAAEDITVLVRLGRGDSQWTMYTCDLSEKYVRINADYRS